MIYNRANLLKNFSSVGLVDMHSWNPAKLNKEKARLTRIT
jgi:hypothetical protein